MRRSIASYPSNSGLFWGAKRSASSCRVPGNVSFEPFFLCFVCSSLRVKRLSRSPYPAFFNSSRSSWVNPRSLGLASIWLRSLSSKLMRLWLRSCIVRGFSIGRNPAITRVADFTMCCALKPNIIAILSVHTSMASPSPLTHSGMEKIVPSATVDTASSPTRTATLPAVLDVVFTTLSATFPKMGETAPVTEPSTMPRPADFKISVAEYPSFSPVVALICPPCKNWLSPSLRPS